jgi:hypothetical protein
MSAVTGDVASFGYGLALLLHGGFAAYLIRSDRSTVADRRAGWAFMAALMTTALWAGLHLVGALNGTSVSALLEQVSDLLRYGLWFFFLLGLFPPPAEAPGIRPTLVLRRVSLVCTAFAAGLLLIDLLPGHGLDLSRATVAASLALPVCGLLILEQLFRNLGGDSRWNAKPVCLGLGCVFVFDIYLFTETLLFGQFDLDALNIRGAVHALAVPSWWWPRAVAPTG